MENKQPDDGSSFTPARRSYKRKKAKILRPFSPLNDKLLLTSSSSQSVVSQHIPHQSFVPIIGREQEVKTLCELLRQPETRLLTITGPGGVGKTRLAMQIFTEMTSEFSDGSCLVLLASLRVPDLVLPAIAQALGLRWRWGRPSHHTLAQILAAMCEKHFLLILDNFEHVVNAALQLKAILSACPYVKVLVTSRTILRLQEERAFFLGPLALPDLSGLLTCAKLEQIASVSLFVQRARVTNPNFALTDENVLAVARICIRLDGLPLALEMAAARLKLFPPQILLARLNDPFSMLTMGRRDVPERQQTLRNTLDWSYSLLTPTEQCLLQRLAVFVGGCSFQAIEAISKISGNLQNSLMDVLTSLINQSWLQGTQSTGEEEQRFTMLETIREYAWECLQGSGEERATHQAHALYFYTQVRDRESEAHNQQKAFKWYQWIEKEFENLRAAFDWFLLERDAESALVMSTALWSFWLRNALTEGENWIMRALEACQHSKTNVQLQTRTQALYVVARLACYRSSWALANTYADEAKRLFQEAGDRCGAAQVLLVQSLCALMQGQYSTAQTAAGESIVGLEGNSSTWFTAEAWLVQAYSFYFQGDSLRAYELGKTALMMSRKTGELYAMTRAVHALALFAKAQGDMANVQCMCEEWLALTRATNQIGLPPQVGICLLGMGAIVALQKHSVWAVHLWGKAYVMYQRRDELSAFSPLKWLLTILGTHLFYARVVEEIYTELGEQAFATFWSEGQTMPLEQLLTYQQSPIVSQAISDTDIVQSQKANTENLTSREREVLRLLAQGLSSAAIAKHLVISLATVNSHVRTIYSKLGVSSRSAATRYAIENNMA